MIGTAKAFVSGLSLAWRLAIIAAVLAAVGWAAWSAYSWAHDRGAASRDGEVATLTTERDDARARVVEVEAANVANVAAIGVLTTANAAFADAAAADRLRAKTEVEALRASIGLLSEQLARTTNERSNAYAADPSARAWSVTAVPVAVDRSLRQ